MMTARGRVVVIVAGSAMAVAVGVAGAVRGGIQIRRGQADMRINAGVYADRHATHLESVAETNQMLQRLGRAQDRALHEVIYRMRDFLERHARQVRAHEHLILDGVDGSNVRVAGMAKLDPDVAGWVLGVVGSVAAGAATPIVLEASVKRLATASTGTAISTLSGAAVENATKAWFGGGSVAVGGGGMALGAVVLNGALAGSALLMAGLTVKNRGTKARTEAEQHKTEIAIAMAQLDARDQLLRGVQRRTREVHDVLDRLITEAVEALDALEAEPLNMDIHAERLQGALILVKTVRDVATAPIADEDLQLDKRTEDLVFQYRSSDRREAASG